MSRKQKITLALTITVLVVVIVFSWVGWNSTKQDLGLTRTELASTQIALESKESELSLTKDNLRIVNNELRSTKDFLSNVQAELQSTRDSLSNVQAELQSTRDSLSNVQAELQATNDSLSNVETELQATKAKLSAIQTDALHLHNPTFEEAISFLMEDKTDANEYVEGEYICSHFARDVNNNAESQGIRCAFVEIRYPELGHSIIAFETVDEGMVYFEPQTDMRARPVIGKGYWWQCVEPEPGYSSYEKPSYDDTIQDILVTW